MPTNLIQQALKQIKQSKKYNTLSNQIIEYEIKEYLKSNPNLKKLDKQNLKQIKKQLHLSYSSFQTKKKKKLELYLEQLKHSNKKQMTKITNKLLSTTLSTKERITDYKKLYNQIFKITGKPKIIIDLASGLNLLSFPLMNIKRLKYYAYDIDNQDIKLLNKYFQIMKPKGLNGKAKILNINNQKQIQKLPKADIVFLFKTIDIIDKTNHKPSEKLIKELIKKSKFIVASFAIRTLTRKKMNFPKRKWFELMLKRNCLKFEIIKIENEVFYVVWES